ncbi:hypothetical protein L682_27155 [Aquipseudomonas alcaligenes OT 69]|nr:hypothetical protein L682_27155 [Pseudomonas alcaligenes OT 69]
MDRVLRYRHDWRFQLRQGLHKVFRVNIPVSMRLASLWVIWFFLAIGALGGGTFAVLDFFDAKKEAAGWVQAIGSIGAILVAVWIAWEKDRRDDAKEAKKELVILQAIQLIAEGGKDVAEKLTAHHVAFDVRAGFDQAREVTGIYIDQLNAIHIVSLPDPEMVKAYFYLVGAMRDLEIKLRELELRAGRGLGDLGERCSRVIKGADSCIELAAKQVDGHQ